MYIYYQSPQPVRDCFGSIAEINIPENFWNSEENSGSSGNSEENSGSSESSGNSESQIQDYDPESGAQRVENYCFNEHPGKVLQNFIKFSLRYFLYNKSKKFA